MIPNAVGVDIGCGMAYTQTNIRVADIKEIMTGNGSLIQAMIGDIMRNVPVGFAHHKTEMPCYTMENAYNELERYEEDEELLGQLEAGFYQIGTLGGGNHFIELQEDNEGYLCVMIHSGSRHIGKSVCDYFHNKARELNRRWYSDVPDEYRLAFLPTDSHEGKQYLNWMQLSMDFARENREKMMLAVKAVLEKYIGKYTDFNLEFSGDINCHHNYAALEHHYDKDVWVHRKGAVRAGNGEMAVIPGAWVPTAMWSWEKGILRASALPPMEPDAAIPERAPWRHFPVRRSYWICRNRASSWGRKVRRTWRKRAALPTRI